MWANALLAFSNVAGAREQSDKAAQLAQQLGDRETKLDAAIAAAQVDAISGHAEAALRALASARKEAHEGGMIQIEFDARLALAETQIASGHKNEGRATLRQPAQDARARGFKLTAQKALAASQG